MGQSLSLKRQSLRRSRPLHADRSTGLIVVLMSASGSIIHRCSDHCAPDRKEVEALQSSDSEASLGEKVEGHSPHTESWWSNAQSASDTESCSGSFRVLNGVSVERGLVASGSGLNSEGIVDGEVASTSFCSSHGTHSQARRGMNESLTLDGRSVGLPSTYRIDFSDGRQATITGPFSEEVFQDLRDGFTEARVEYWGQKFRVEMPSSPISEKDPVSPSILCWESRVPSRSGVLRSFQSSAVFDPSGPSDAAGDQMRVAPDVSVTTEDRYKTEFARDRFVTKVPKDFIPETCVEIRLEGNRTGDLEMKALIMLASGAKECIIVDGLMGKVTQVWTLEDSESVASLQKEFTSPSTSVTIDTFEKLLSPSNRPSDLDSSLKVVTVVDTNPRLVRSRCWDNLHFDMTPLKLDALYWLPTAKLIEVTSTGLEIEEVGERIMLKPCSSNADRQNHPKLLRDAPDPAYTLDEIAWAENAKVPSSMATRCIEGIRVQDPLRFLEGLTHLSSVNVYDTEGQVPLVEAAKVGDLEAIKVLLREGAHPHFPDRSGMTAVIAAKLLKHTSVAANLPQAPPTEEEILSVLVKCTDTRIIQGFLQGGGNLEKLLLKLVKSCGADKLESVLTRWGVGMEDAMDAAIKSRSQVAVEAIMEKGVDPNAPFIPQGLSAIEYLTGDPGKLEVESRELVRFLLEKKVAYDVDEVKRLAKKRRRDDWLA